MFSRVFNINPNQTKPNQAEETSKLPETINNSKIEAMMYEILEGRWQCSGVEPFQLFSLFKASQASERD